MSKLNGVVTIQAHEYQRLLERDLDLEYLESNGVDNWIGYGDGECREDKDDAILLKMVQSKLVA